MEHLLQKRANASFSIIFFKYMIFHRRQKALLWSKFRNEAYILTGHIDRINAMRTFFSWLGPTGISSLEQVFSKFNLKLRRFSGQGIFKSPFKALFLIFCLLRVLKLTFCR